MTRESRIRISRRDAEKVLAGEGTSTPALAALIAAARSAAPAGGSVPGEAEALASFRVAHAAEPWPAAKRTGRIAAARAAAVAALSTKLAAGAVAALAAGGVVLAASTGVLPGTGTSDHGTHHAPSASPTPDLRGLCTAYRAEVAQAPGKALENPAYSALATAARPDTVANYCAALLAGGGPTSRPSTSHPTGSPTTHPTGAPTSHPTGRPTTLPSTAHPHASVRPSDRPTVPAAPHMRTLPPQHR